MTVLCNNGPGESCLQRVQCLQCPTCFAMSTVFTVSTFFAAVASSTRHRLRDC
jgi:hypothetical protein